MAGVPSEMGIPQRNFRVLAGNWDHRLTDKISTSYCLQFFDIVSWTSERAASPYNIKWHSTGMIVSESQCKLFAYGPADATATPSSRFIKIQNGLSFCCRLTHAVLDLRLLNKCCCCYYYYYYYYYYQRYDSKAILFNMVLASITSK